MRRRLVVLLVVGMIVLAGCAGADSSDDGPAVEDADELVEAAGDETTADTDDAGEENDTPNESSEDGTDETDPPTEPDSEESVDGTLEIHHLDVGQADSALLITPEGETILIDTGDWRQDGSGVIEYLEEHDIDRIDHLVATHGHADHIGGHAAVIEHFETERDGIGAAYDSGVPHTSQTYENYLDAIDEYDVELFEIQEGDALPIEGNLSGTVLNPLEGDSGSDLHYNSVTIVFEFGDVRYLTTGDAETDAEQRMVDEWADDLKADIYQAGHHGSSTSSTPVFLDAVAPEIAIISSNYDSQYGHPHDEVLEAFGEREIETYWTGVHGDVVVTTDGEEITIETSEDFSTDPANLLEEKPDDDDASSLAAPPIDVAVAPAVG